MEKALNGIMCKACKCVHNDGDCHCTAPKVEIGRTTACSCQDTLCATFELQSN